MAQEKYYSKGSRWRVLTTKRPRPLIGALSDMKKKRTFRKFTYREVDLDQLLDMNHEQLIGALLVQDQEKVLPRPKKKKKYYSEGSRRRVLTTK